MKRFSHNRNIIFEDTHFPLVEAWFHDGHEDGDWAWLLEQFEQLFARKARYVLLLDAGALTRTPSAQARLRISEWQNAHAHNTARYCVGSCLYISSGLVRGAMTAMNWFAPQVVPLFHPASMSEGLDWCVTRLDEASLGVPSAIRQRQLALLADASTRRRASDY